MKIMVLAATLAALVPLPACSQAASGGSSSTGPTITGIQAYLFQNKTGKLSDDLLDANAPALWNTFAGPDAANATMVVVEVSGAAGANYAAPDAPRYLLRLVAREAKRSEALLDQKQSIPVLSASGKAYIAFLLYQGGCAPVLLTANIEGQRSTPVERSLDFACGE